MATGEHIHRVRNETVEVEGFGGFVGHRLGFRFIRNDIGPEQRQPKYVVARRGKNDDDSSQTRNRQDCSLPRHSQRRKIRLSMPGFGNDFETESLPGALPQRQVIRLSAAPTAFTQGSNYPGSPFTAPRGFNERLWLYRHAALCSRHIGRFQRGGSLPTWKTAPHIARSWPAARPFCAGIRFRCWATPSHVPDRTAHTDDGRRCLRTQVGMAAHVYFVNLADGG